MITEDQLEDERAVLGSMLLDRHRIDEVVFHVAAADFADRIHRELFVVLVDLHDCGEPSSVEALSRTLRDSGRFDDVGGATMMARLSAATGTPSEAAYYAARVRRAAMVRNLQGILSEALERAQRADSGTASVSGVLDFVDERLAQLRERDRAGSDRITPLHEAASRLCDEVDAAAEAGTVRGLRTGLDCFDRVNGGFQNGTLNVIAARPSNGKSVLGLQFAQGIGAGFEYSLYDGGNYIVTQQEPRPVLFTSLEMTEEELTARALSSVTEIDSRRINSCRVAAGERKKLREAADDMRSGKTILWEPARATVSAIRAKARTVRRQQGLSCLIVDYLQLIDTERGGRSDNERYRVGDICRGLKALAKEMEIPVVVLCQLNRLAENQMPTLAHLSDSGLIEAHADTVTAIHRKRDDSTEAEIPILKWRNGQTVALGVEFDRQHCRFAEALSYSEFAAYA